MVRRPATAGADSFSADHLIGSVLTTVRRGLDMDVAFVAKFEDGERIFRHVSTRLPTPPLVAGDRDALEETYAQRVVDGRAASVIPDVAADPRLAALPLTKRLGIASFVGVPITLSDGALYGALCSYSQEPRPRMGERTSLVLATVAELIAEWIEAEELVDAVAKRARTRVIDVLEGRQPLEMVFQPIVDVRTGVIVGAEALARFPGSDVGPQQWFDDADLAGLGGELGVAAVSAAIARLDELPAHAYLSVNLSAQTLGAAVASRVFEIADSGRIVVELTEHAAVDDYAMLDISVGRLRSLGVRIAVDDAGTGYSSLSHILRLRPDVIKLDRDLITGIDHDPVRRSLATALQRFAEEIDAAVVAEGVEEPAELQTVLTCGVHLVQGYLLARPGPLPLRVADVATARPRPRVVVVEDDPLVRRVVTHHLTRGGFDVVGEAGDGIEGIVAAATHQPDVILLDNHMPRLAGRDAVGRLRQVAPAAVVVVLTASGGDSVHEWPDVPDGVLDKTDRVEDLPHEVQVLLAQGQRTRTTG